MSEQIDMQSMVSMRDGRPYVQLSWGNESGQLTPAEARMHALAVMECAEAAETDALVFRAMTAREGPFPGNTKHGAMMIQVLRDERAKGWADK